MEEQLRLAAIPVSEYSDYRYEVIFKAYKWDPQVGDRNTVANHAVLLGRETARRLEEWAEALSAETMALEEALIKKPHLAKELGLPKKTLKAIDRLEAYDREKNVRLMRFDFHPTSSGWAVSEVNSDVPGGLAESSLLPGIAARFFEGYGPGPSTGDMLLEAFESKIKKSGTVAFIHATSYSDDRQVMQYLSDRFEARGFNTVFAAPDHIGWRDKKAVCLLKGREGPLDGLVRFFPLEWLGNLPRSADWKGYFDSETPSCNHPAAIFAQSKALPLVWDKLGVDLPAWRALLPETKSAKTADARNGGWIYKPVLGRVGEGISIKEALNQRELKLIEKAARRYPKDWVAQRRFESLPLESNQGGRHLCLGVFTVDGKRAGFYGRVSSYPRIDDKAQDIPILVEREDEHNERQS